MYPSWHWGDNGGVIDYTNWKIGQPEGHGKDCMILHEGVWSNVNCGQEYLFICQVPDT